MLTQQVLSLVLACATLNGVHRTFAHVALERPAGIQSRAEADGALTARVAANLPRCPGRGPDVCSTTPGGDDSARPVDACASASDPDDDGADTLALWHLMIASPGPSVLEPPGPNPLPAHSSAPLAASVRPLFLSLCCFQC